MPTYSSIYYHYHYHYFFIPHTLFLLQVLRLFAAKPSLLKTPQTLLRKCLDPPSEETLRSAATTLRHLGLLKEAKGNSNIFPLEIYTGMEIYRTFMKYQGILIFFFFFFSFPLVPSPSLPPSRWSNLHIQRINCCFSPSLS